MTTMNLAPNRRISLACGDTTWTEDHTATTFRQIAHALDTGDMFAETVQGDQRTDRQRWASAVHFAVRLAGRSEELLAFRDRCGSHGTGCSCGMVDPGGIGSVLCDYAQAPEDPVAAPGHAMGLTLRRPWASMLMVPTEAGGKNVENRTDTTTYRGPVLIYAGARLDQAGVELGRRQGLQCMDFHAAQQGWLGAAVLVDVHRARGCCAPWGNTRKTQQLYHWVFESPVRLARRPWRGGARGFVGLQQVSWSALINPKVYRGA
ncbi:hypothetical protein BTO20_36805 (plasmid) [Mycobacterium dioxanotrophicus]|uniref:Uncharacterized protein n=1 Tax=Mycobacterium dioxanotrophicus TaxID=482462 RepID=A0A1Y0CG00_9MYCO|nr:hypothetical protein [Mycobacterium dioxanotrophicus]ART74218.1 hypothetical protein BTO20_36805 [Mycobacterium dioxanotrophicus]